MRLSQLGSQGIPGVTGELDLGVQNEAGPREQSLPREHTDYIKHPLPAKKEMTTHMDMNRWSIPKSD